MYVYHRAAFSHIPSLVLRRNFCFSRIQSETVSMVGSGGTNKASLSESRSASTWVTDTIIGSHDFEVRGYSSIKGLGVGEHITSDVFTVDGYSWKMNFYPDGDVDENKDYVSIFLELVSDAATDVRTFFEITLFDQIGKPRNNVMESELHTFGKTTNNSWGWDQYCSRTDMEADYLKDDCLHFGCRVSIFRSHTGYTNSIPLPPSNIIQHLGRLLESGQGADVKFEVDGEIFHAHKTVLAARSLVFNAQFFGAMKDSNADYIKIEDMKAPVFKALLHFIYWDVLPDLEELTGIESKQASFLMSQHLLAAADRYNLDRLILICASKLCNDIIIENVVTILSLAGQHNCLPLKSACLKFIALTGNLQGVVKTDDFKYLEENSPNLFLELLKYLAGINHIAANNQGTEGVVDGSDGNELKPRKILNQLDQ